MISEERPVQEQPDVSNPGQGLRGTAGSPPSRESIAIIGISGRYPMSRNLDEYWRHLLAAADCVTEIPPDRWPLDEFFCVDPPSAVEQRKSYSKWGGFLDSFAEFDPLFFGIPPRQALVIDPQERLFLQACWEVFENAGYTRELLKRRHHGRVGVFAGITNISFCLQGPPLWETGSLMIPCTSFSSVANRVSYTFNLRGPSMPIDTMCSASLTAIHEACEHLLRDECELAIAGGVNLYLHQASYNSLCQLRMLSSDGRCKSFGKGGNGFVPGEGVGVVLLKRLSRAQADRDHIHAIVRSTNINHGGKTNGYTVPSPTAQRELVRTALDRAGIHARTISYIEAHGTGTELGDPIEVAGLAQAFEQDTTDKQFCAIGSAKSNIGHLESAAGIAGLTKIVLQMQHRTLVPSLHAQELNPNINFANTPFRVQRELSEWRRPVVSLNGESREYPRIAGVSSFGAGGSNAHVIVEEYIAPQDRVTPELPSPQRPALVLLSAKTPERLREQAKQLLEVLQQRRFTAQDLPNIAYTLQVGREAMGVRWAVKIASLAELEEHLVQYLNETPASGVHLGEARRSKAAQTAFDDAEGAKAVHAWIAAGEYEELLEAWVRGAVVEWELLHEGEQPRRIPLPTYPFAREKYWIAEQYRAAVPSQPAVPRPAAAASRAERPQSALPQTAARAAHSAAASGETTLLLTPSWQVPQHSTSSAAGAAHTHVVALCEFEISALTQLGSHLPGARLVSLSSNASGLDARFLDCGLRLLELLQELLKQKPRQQVLLQIAVPANDEAETGVFRALSGFAKTVRLEDPRFLCQVVALDVGEPPAQLAQKLMQCAAQPADVEIRFAAQHCTVASFQPLSLMRGDSPRAAWRDGGVYLITGGAGGLGLIFANDIASRTRGAKVILIGRSPLQERKRSELQRLRGTLQVEYLQVDLADAAAVEALIPEIAHQHGPVTGVLHCAGVLRDSFAIRKTPADLSAVLAPKVSGVLNLDRALAQTALEFFVCFSSVSATFGNIGQVDYALANAFLDQFMLHRNALARRGERHGRSLSINWPLWQDGGMQMEEDSARDKQEQGIYALPTADGVAAFHAAVASQEPQVIVLAGDVTRLRERTLGSRPEAQGVPQTCTASAPAGAVLQQRTLERLRDVFSATTRISVEQIDVHEALESYGIDSIMVMQLGRSLEPIFQSLPKTVFFECSTLAELAQHLAQAYVQECADWCEGRRAARLTQFSVTVAQDSDALAQPAPRPESSPPSVHAKAQLEQRTLARLKEAFAAVARIAPATIDVREPLEAYGINSALIVQLNRLLETAFAGLSKTLFYEYATLAEVAAHLCAMHAPACEVWGGVSQPQSTEQRDSRAAVAAAPHAGPDDAASGSSASVPAPAVPQLQPPAAVDSTVKCRREPIAIVGLSGRYPQAATLAQFWSNLSEARDCITEIPPERWSLDGFYCEDPESAVIQNKSYSRWGGFVEGFADFDPLFFGITPRDAINIDPQERLLLQACWQGLEDAGYTRELIEARHRGRVGVFVGITRTGFVMHGMELRRQGHDVRPFTSFSSMANRISYFLNLRGPSMPIDTMCSASLTAIHEACEYLLRDECELAIAGGVNLYLHSSNYIDLSTQGMLSTSGRCKSFGSGAAGFVPGEGVGVVLLKRLSRAQADGDHIHAVVRSTSINHCGKTNGYTVPNPIAQRELIRSALDRAGIHARAVSYIEAHGTGTQLGDPIEIAGLTQAFAQDTADKQFCAIGSVKSNIGHLEAAAGMAGLTKVVLQMQHGTLLPSLHAAELNPNIDFAKTPFKVQRELAEWQRPILTLNGERREYPRIAGISSFGAGGSNAHVILEEYLEPQLSRVAAAPSAQQPALVLLSAKTREQLREQVAQLLGVLRERRFVAQDLADLAYTLQVGREAMGVRWAVKVARLSELEERLVHYLSDAAASDIYLGEVKRNKEILAAFNDDEDTAATIRSWIAKGKYDKLLDLWVKGLNVDWETLHGTHPPRRISLPGYPFAKERYWIALASEQPEQRPISVEPPAALRGMGEDIHLFSEQWEAQPIERHAPRNMSGRILCFVPEDAAMTSVADRLAQLAAGCEVVRVLVTQHDTGRGEPGLRVCAADASTYLASMRQVAGRGEFVDSVIYLCGSAGASDAREDAALVHLVQALAAARVRAERLLLVVPYRDALGRCHAESYVGLVRSLKQALPHLRAGAMCSEVGEDLAARIWAELAVSTPQSVWYEGRSRHVLRVRSLPSARPANVLRTGGTYLITGGCGGLGRLLAQHLARRYACNLVLTGRSPPGERVVQLIRDLEQRGARAIYLQADVCDTARMQQVVAQVHERFGALHGVVHAAGVVDERSILQKDAAGFEQILAPKIAGTVALDRALASETLDFLCYFSSSAAVLGDFGTADYATANRFQLAHARHRNVLRERAERTGVTLAISWPLWQEGGMGFQSEAATQLYLKTSGQRALSSQEGLELFESLLGSNQANVLVLAGSRERVRRLVGLDADAGAVNVAPPAEPRGAGESAPPGEDSLTQHVLQDLLVRASRVVKVPVARLDVDLNLADIGFDSIGMWEFALGLGRDCGIDLTPTVFYLHPTLRGFAAYLLATYPALFEQRFERRSQPAPVAGAPAKETHAPSSAAAQDRDGQIAVVGMSGRFPRANDVESFWRNLENGVDCVSPLPPARWGHGAQARRGDAAGTLAELRGGFIDGADQFDPLFFNLSPREASGMDPQERLFLEVAWNLLETSCVTRRDLKDQYRQNVGVYVGSVYRHSFDVVPPQIGKTVNELYSHGAIANRVSYFFDLRGPSVAVDTLCSSSALAIHLACADLARGECELAIAGGLHLVGRPTKFAALNDVGVLSSRPERRSFAAGDGYVPAEAAGAVLLKPLQAAVRDGDRILAVIRATTTNHNGRSNGFAAPNPQAQAALMRSALHKARVEAGSISYIEAAANGAAIADALEVAALEEVFAAPDAGAGACSIGSVKSNLGHPEAASGIAQLFKVILQLRHRKLVPSINAEPRNPELKLSGPALRLQTECADWLRPIQDRGGRRQEVPLRALINSYGGGGSNVALIVEEHVAAAVAAPAQCSGEPQVFVMSARDDTDLAAAARELRAFLQANAAQLELAQVCQTLQLGREAMEVRLAFIARDLDQVSAQLQSYLAIHAGSHEVPSGIHLGTVLTSASLQELRAGTLRRSMQSAVRERDLTQLAQLWTQGVEVDWRALHPAVRFVERSLPTYPFKRQSFATFAPAWSDADRAAEDATAAPLAAASAPPAAGAGSIQERIALYVAHELALPASEIQIHRDLRDFGADSLFRMRLKRWLQASFGVEVSHRRIIEMLCVAQLSEFVAGSLCMQRSEPAASTEPRATVAAVQADVPSDGESAFLEAVTAGLLEVDEFQRLMDEGAAT